MNTASYLSRVMRRKGMFCQRVLVRQRFAENFFRLRLCPSTILTPPSDGAERRFPVCQWRPYRHGYASRFSASGALFSAISRMCASAAARLAYFFLPVFPRSQEHLRSLSQLTKIAEPGSGCINVANITFGFMRNPPSRGRGRGQTCPVGCSPGQSRPRLNPTLGGMSQRVRYHDR